MSCIRHSQRTFAWVLTLALCLSGGLRATASGTQAAASPAYDYVWPTYNGLAQFEQDGLIGLLDEDGNVVQEAVYYIIYHYGTKGQMLAGYYDGICQLSAAGELLFQVEGAWETWGNAYEDAPDDSVRLVNAMENGTVPVPYGNSITVYADGTVPLDNMYVYGAPFANGNAFFRNDETGLYQLRAPDARTVCEEWWRDAICLSDGTALVRSSAEDNRIMDADGRTVRDLSHVTTAHGYAGGLLAAKDNATGLYGYLDTSGAFAIEPAWHMARDFQQGVAFVRRDGLWGLIDSDGRVLAEPQWEQAMAFEQQFSEGFAAVPRGGLWGYIDLLGNVVYDYQWMHARAFHEGYAFVYGLDGLCGFVSAQGQVVAPQWNNGWAFENGRARVSTGTARSYESYYIDTTGQPVPAPDAPSPTAPLTDAHGNPLPQLDRIYRTGTALAFVQFQDMRGEILRDGTVISGIKGVERFEGVGW